MDYIANEALERGIIIFPVILTNYEINISRLEHDFLFSYNYRKFSAYDLLAASSGNVNLPIFFFF